MVKPPPNQNKLNKIITVKQHFCVGGRRRRHRYSRNHASREKQMRKEEALVLVYQE